MTTSRTRRPPPARLPVVWLASAGGQLGQWAALTVLTAAAASTVVTGQGLAAVGIPIVRGVMDAAGVAFVGLALLGVLLPRDHRRYQLVITSSLQPAVIVAGVWLVAAVLLIVFSAAPAFGRSITTVGGSELLAWVTRIGAGQGLLLAAGGATLVLVTAVLRLGTPDLVPPRAVLGAALFALITPAVTGHAAVAVQYQVISVASIGLHVAAAALWIGGLGAMLLLVARHRGLLVAALPRFSQLAAACIATVAASGVAAAWIRLLDTSRDGGTTDWAAILGSGWGQLLIAKAAALAAVGGFGWITRRRIASSRMPLLLWAGHELALMAIALGLAAALTQSPLTPIASS